MYYVESLVGYFKHLLIYPLKELSINFHFLFNQRDQCPTTKSHSPGGSIPQDLDEKSKIGWKFIQPHPPKDLVQGDKSPTNYIHSPGGSIPKIFAWKAETWWNKYDFRTEVAELCLERDGVILAKIFSLGKMSGNDIDIPVQWSIPHRPNKLSTGIIKAKCSIPYLLGS